MTDQPAPKSSLTRDSPTTSSTASLHPHLMEEACAAVGQKITVNRREGYDHSYFFIASVIGDHLRHHAASLVES